MSEIMKDVGTLIYAVCIYTMSQTIVRMPSDIRLWWHLLVPCSSCCTHPTHETVQDTDSSYNQVMLLLSGSLTFPKWRGNCHFYRVSKAMSPHCLQMSWQRMHLLFKLFNPLTPGKLRKNGTFKHQMALFSPCLIQFRPNTCKKCFLA